jgi:radical S-adenosyl methionine domain-containing protein 2
MESLSGLEMFLSLLKLWHVQIIIATGLFALCIIKLLAFLQNRENNRGSQKNEVATVSATEKQVREISEEQPQVPFKPLSVNYFISRVCNYSCGFCFHTAKTKDMLPLDKAKEGLRMLQDYGLCKINFAGGEPFLQPKYLGELCKFCKETLHIESVSIISNGSKIKEKWLQNYGQYVDILGISCDSFDEETNKKIGRGTGRHCMKVYEIAEWCRQYSIRFKLNTVVNAYNWEEDMNEHIEKLQPFRWKVFQVLLLEGENTGADALRNGLPFRISSEQFQAFLKRHSSQKCLVDESNAKMQNSYLMLDENMCFLNCAEGGKIPSESIFDVGVPAALTQAGFDEQMFWDRGGKYDWSRDPLNKLSNYNQSCTAPDNSQLAW